MDQQGKTLHFQVRYKIDGYWSGWTKTQRVMPAITVVAPSLTIEKLDGGSPILKTGFIEFSIIGVTSTHVSTEWEILKDGVRCMGYELTDALGLIEATVPSGVLEVETTYVVRARHISEDYGEWGKC